MAWERLKADKSDAIKLTFWIPAALHAASKQAASNDGRSLSNWVRFQMDEAIRKKR